MIIEKTHSDYEMEIYLMKGQHGDLYIVQDRPFESGELSWLEYSKEDNMINFIMNDGEIRDFGMPIDPQFATNLSEYKNIPVALIQNSLFIDGAEYPFIVHGEN